MISSRHLRYRYQIFQNFKPVAIVAVPVDKRKKLGGGSEQNSQKGRMAVPFLFRLTQAHIYALHCRLGCIGQDFELVFVACTHLNKRIQAMVLTRPS
jgi:hypothetical protein